LPVIDSTIIKQKLKQIEEQITLQNNHSWPCRSRTFLFEILFSLVRPEERNDAIFSNQIEPSFSKLTINVIFFLQTSYNKKLTIENLAQIFHTNRTTLLADFKKSTGQSINRYLTQLRMTMAATLLRDTDLSINEICERTGFSDISYFSKSFKKIVQLTPTEYRRINVS
jgi:AraC family L-rhamnose operon regulatory protein RhaS